MEITKVSTEPVEPPIGWADALGQEAENPPTARTQGRQLFEPDGTVHTISSCENRIKAQFELWVQNNALRAISQVENAGDTERADKMMSAYLGDFGAGHYTWDGKIVRRARFESFSGFAQLLYLLLVRCNPQMTIEKATELLSKHSKQCGELIRWALGNSPSPEKAGDNGK